MIYIGIDTGVHTGIAIWDGRKRLFEMIGSVKIHQAMKIVLEKADACTKEGVKLVVRVEDPRQRTWYETNNVPRDEERKRLQGVGSVKRDATIWADFLEEQTSNRGRSMMEYQMVAPKHNVTKMSAERFKALTGYQGRTNEHARDAAMLVYGF